MPSDSIASRSARYDSCARRYAAASSCVRRRAVRSSHASAQRTRAGSPPPSARMRQVVQRRKRCSVRQSRRRLDDAGLAVGASVGDLEDAAGLATQLPRDGVEIRPLSHREAERPAAVEREAHRVAARGGTGGTALGMLCGSSAMVCHSDVYQAGPPARPWFPAPARSAAPHPAAAAPDRGCRRASRTRAARGPGPRCKRGHRVSPSAARGRRSPHAASPRWPPTAHLGALGEVRAHGTAIVSVSTQHHRGENRRPPRGRTQPLFGLLFGRIGDRLP